MEGWLIGSVVTLFGLLSLGYAIYLHQRATEARSWPRADGSIAQVSLKHHSTTRDDEGSGARREWYLPEVRYTYQVRGRSFSGDRIIVGEVQPMDHSDALEMVRRYRDGMKVRVHYNPRNPAEAVLEPRAHGSSVFMYAAIGIGLLAAVVWVRFFWDRFI